MTGMRGFSGWRVPHLIRSSNLDRMARRVFHRILTKFRFGRLHLVEGNKRYTVGYPSDVHNIEATIFIKNPRFYRKVLATGFNGAAESFAHSHWSADNLTDTLRLLLLNWSMLEQSYKEWNKLSTPAVRLLNLTHQTIENSKKQVSQVNKVSGEELDTLIHNDTKSHTCGIFSRPNTTLSEAVSAAHERLCRKLRLKAEDNVLEICQARGGFANHAATRYGCHVDEVILSAKKEQASLRGPTANEVNDRVRIIKKDSRFLTGRYDKLVIIENISSMSRSGRDCFFKDCNRLLEADGVLALQTVLRTGMACRRFFDIMNGAGHFMQQGGCFPSLPDISRSIESNTDLRLIHLEDLTPHYAVTMKRWREQLYANVDRARDTGISEYVLRRRAFDLCFGEAAFAERLLGCAQMIYAKSLSRHTPILPPLASKFGVILQKRKNEVENWMP